MEQLIEPTNVFIHRVENSWHYLCCPKYKLNDELDVMYRHGIVQSKEIAIDYVLSLLRNRNDKKTPRQIAINFVEWRDSLTRKEFELININSYNKKLPTHIIELNKKVLNWVQNNIKIEYGIKISPTYPFLFANY